MCFVLKNLYSLLDFVVDWLIIIMRLATEIGISTQIRFVVSAQVYRVFLITIVVCTNALSTFIDE